MFRRRTAHLVFIVVIGVGFFLLGDAHAALAQSTDVGYRDFNYGTGINEPTADKPQSKLWFNDGIWWGSLWNPSVRRWEIHRFDWNTNTWTSTGTAIDGRGNVRPDVLWDGTQLYIATAPNDTGSTDQRALVRRYRYDRNNKSYTLDPNFPAAVASGPMETIVIDKDTTGKLWVTFTQGSKVYVNRSLDSDSSWGTPFIPPALSGTTVSPDDISSVVSFDRQTGPPQIGLMWSNQNNNAMYFATHRDGDPDGVWQPTQLAVGGPKYADDHISLKSLEADSSGRVFAAVKTSLNDATTTTPNPDDPLILLLVLGQQNQWNKYTFGRVRDNHTKPIVTIDQINRKLYMFATGPTGTIYYKQTDLDNISFPVGFGTPFIKSTNNINNVTSTKQNITQASGIASTGLLVLASDNVNRYYWHNTIQTAASPPSDTTAPETTIDSGPSGTVSSASASFGFSSSEAGSTFQCSLDGAAFASCSSPKDYTGLSDGSHTFEVKATDAAGNTDATPASRSWTVETSAPLATAPVQGFIADSTVSKQGASAVLVELTWSGTGTGDITGYELQRSTNGGAYVGVALPSATATSVTDRLEPGNAYQFRVRAKDQFGNWSAWQEGQVFNVGAYQESDSAIVYSGTWSTQSFSSAYGGSVKYTGGLKSQQAKFTFFGSEIAWVTSKGIDRGMADVYLDGAKVSTVDLYSNLGSSRNVVFAKKGLDPTVEHTLEVRALGTKNAASSGMRVDVDAFVVLR
jgi:hypothetical protein